MSRDVFAKAEANTAEIDLDHLPVSQISMDHHEKGQKTQ